MDTLEMRGYVDIFLEFREYWNLLTANKIWVQAPSFWCHRSINFQMRGGCTNLLSTNYFHVAHL